MKHTPNTLRASHGQHRRTNPLTVISIMAGCIVALLLVVYVVVALYFTGRFMPNTTAAGMSLSMMTAPTAENSLNDRLHNYRLEVSGEGLDLTLSPADTGQSIDSQAVVKDMLSDVNPWLWPFQIGSHHDESDKLIAGSSTNKLADTLNTAIKQVNDKATPPKNASLAYNATTHQFGIAPEAAGTTLDEKAVLEVIEQALSTLEHKVTITPAQLQQPTLLANDPRLASAVKSANGMITTNLELTMGNFPVARVDADLISQWVTLDDKVNATINQDALSAWVTKLAEDNTTVGSTRTYTRPDGKRISVKGGVYGWAVDKDALLKLVQKAVASGTVDTVAIPTTTHGDAYNGAGKQDWGKRYLDIDLTEQHARLYDDNGSVIWESDVITGSPDGEHETPTGVYWMNQPQSPSILKGYSGDKQIYATKVQYWMPFVGGAIGLHDADWQTSGFGGTLYEQGLGSHGCVNLPHQKAGELYALIKPGDVVVSHN